jgi:serine/threonine protein kinase
MISKTLGHYEITSQLGKGGMGEVYEAKELKLGQDVAIKVLPGELAKDDDRVARFQREATLRCEATQNLNADQNGRAFGKPWLSGKYQLLSIYKAKISGWSVQRPAINITQLNS